MRAQAERLLDAIMQSDHKMCREFRFRAVSGDQQVGSLYGRLGRKPLRRMRPGDQHLTYPPEFNDRTTPGWGQA